MQSKLVRVISLLVILAVTFVTPPAPTQAQATTVIIDDGCPGNDPPGFERRALPAQDAWICISAQHPGQIYWAYNSDALYVSTAANPMEWVRWRPTITIAGRYLVEASIPSYFSNSPKTQQARYMVHHADGDTWVIVNQAATAGSWQNLGTYRFNAGTDGYVYDGYVYLESYTGESTAHLVAADAVRFTFTNQPPNVPNLASPANGSTTTNPGANLCLQDTGDPDNYPRNYRDYYYRIEATDGSWGQESGWTTSTCWGVTVPSAGAYRWRAQSGDGEVGSGWTGWWTFSYNAPPPPALTRSGLYLHGSNYLALEFCGTNIHQDVYIGSKRAGRDFGIHAMRVDFGTTEQCATDSNLADGTVLPSTIYYSGVALRAEDVYVVCSSFGGLCDSITTPPAKPIDPPQPPPGGSCPVPHYWQQDPRWAANKLGACTGPCGTIGGCGCALTSLAMTFKYYGANRDPGSLAACLGKSACPLVWSPACSEGKVTYNGWRAFNWSQLAAELQQGRPVILQLNRSGGMHFVVAVSGSGTGAQNYLVNDPALKQGARVTLSAVLVRRNYTPNSMRLFSGTPGCQASGAGDESGVPIVPELASTDPRADLGQVVETIAPSSVQPVTGTVVMYRNTETDMTLELAAQSSAGTVTEMLIWTDSITNTTWQPFAQYVRLPLSEQFFVQFKDDAGNISAVISGTSDPVASPSQWYPVFMPIISRDYVGSR